MTIEPSRQVNGYDIETAICLLGPANFGNRTTCYLCDFLVALIKNIVVTIMRVLNFVCGDHQWYNNNTARQIVEDYYRGPQENVELRERIDHLYSLLQRRANGDVSYAEGIQVPPRAVVSTSTIPTSAHIRQEIFDRIEECLSAGYIDRREYKAEILIKMAEILAPSDQGAANAKFDEAMANIDSILEPEKKADHLINLAKVKIQISPAQAIEPLRRAAISTQNIWTLKRIAQMQILINPELINETLPLVETLADSRSHCEDAYHQIIENLCIKAINEFQENEQRAEATLQKAFRIAEELSDQNKIDALFHIAGAQAAMRGQDHTATLQHIFTFATENHIDITHHRYFPLRDLEKDNPELFANMLHSIHETIVNSNHPNIISRYALVKAYCRLALSHPQNAEELFQTAREAIDQIDGHTNTIARFELVEAYCRLALSHPQNAEELFQTAREAIDQIGGIVWKTDAYKILLRAQSQINVNAAREIIDLFSQDLDKVDGLCILAEGQAQTNPSTCTDILTEALDVERTIVYRWVGDHNPKIDSLSRIAKALSKIGIDHISNSFFTGIIETLIEGTIVCSRTDEKNWLEPTIAIAQAVQNRPNIASQFALWLNRLDYSGFWMRNFFVPISLQLKIQLNPSQSRNIFNAENIRRRILVRREPHLEKIIPISPPGLPLARSIQAEILNKAARFLFQSNPVESLNLYRLSMDISIDSHRHPLESDSSLFYNIKEILNSIKDL